MLIENLNTEKQQQFSQMTTMNEQLMAKISKLENDNDELRDERQSLVEKCRDLQWTKDQKVKTINKTMSKLKADFD